MYYWLKFNILNLAGLLFLPRRELCFISDIHYANIPDILFYNSFSAVSRLKSFVPLVKVVQGIPIQICKAMLYMNLKVFMKGYGDNWR